MGQSWRLLHGYEQRKNSFVGNDKILNPLKLDVGGSQYIIDGRIKLKNDSQIQGFTEKGLKFEDGSELEADVVLFCTGFVCLSAVWYSELNS